MKNKDIITFKQDYETMGLNSVDIRLEKENEKVFLSVILTDFNPFKQRIKRYSLNRISNYNNSDFLFYLKKILNTELPY